ncbi:LysE family translocator [Hahella ganghwensis]|uniref:LysE family translocator n=1 Tax=Hahella ganghwensis TaxID=286420 RepID=UPI00037DF379|nr:LysE family translocator [Hahella ganghwensis]
MDVATLSLYTLVAFGAVLSPGPAVLLAITLGTQVGLRKTWFAIAGNVVGLALVSLLSAIGLGAVLAASGMAFMVLKFVGAAYLIYLGIKSWKDKNFLRVDDSGQAINDQVKGLDLFRRAFLIAVTNPKAILFFTALFPQFVNTEIAVVSQLVVLTAIFMGISFTVLSGYALIGSKAQKWLFEPIRLRWFKRVTGGLFVSMGVLLATQTRAQPV